MSRRGDEPRSWWQVAATSLLLAAILGPAAGDGGAVGVVRARLVDPASDVEINRLRDDLLARGPGSFSEGRFAPPDRSRHSLYREDVRSSLARSLDDVHVVREIRAAADAADSPAERLRDLLTNLRGRLGLGRALLAENAFDSAATVAAEELANVAGDDLLDGDATLATALLSRPELASRGADRLAYMKYAQGLSFVADVITGDVAVPGAARDALAELDLNLGDIRGTRPLGAERRTRLLHVARTDEDPALRVAAAHVLHFADTPDAAADAYTAKAAARSHRIDDDEWDWLGRSAWPSSSSALSTFERARAVRGGIYLSHIRASDDPLYAEHLASELQALYAATPDQRMRGALVRLVTEVAYCFADSRAGRPRLVPSFTALLDDWERAGAATDTALGDLEARVARRLRSELERGDLPSRLPPLIVPESAALVAIPERAPDAQLTGTAIEAWLTADPAHLHDRAVRTLLVSWGDEDLARVLSAYPEAALRAMLAEPPTVGRPIGRDRRSVHDPSGSAARQPLLDLLASDPRHAARLRDRATWTDWPRRDRRYAGAQLHRLACEDVGLGDAALADDDFALGFVDEAFAGDGGAKDAGLLLAARVIASTDSRPDLRARIVDGDAGDARPSVVCGLQVDDATFARLLDVATADVDPCASLAAARLLVATGRPTAFAAVLRQDEWLACADRLSSTAIVAAVADLVHDDRTRDSVLEYVADDAGSATGRVQAFATLAALDWVTELFGEDAPDELIEARLEREIAALGGWLRLHLGTLDADVAEGVASAWLDVPIDALAEERWESGDRWIGSTLEESLATMPDGAVKRRIAALPADD